MYPSQAYRGTDSDPVAGNLKLSLYLSTVSSKLTNKKNIPYQIAPKSMEKPWRVIDCVCVCFFTRNWNAPFVQRTCSVMLGSALPTNQPTIHWLFVLKGFSNAVLYFGAAGGTIQIKTVSNMHPQKCRPNYFHIFSSVASYSWDSTRALRVVSSSLASCSVGTMATSVQSATSGSSNILSHFYFTPSAHTLSTSHFRVGWS